MNFKEYIDTLIEFSEEHPESLELEVIYSKDDEGNGHDTVKYTPTIGCYSDNEFDDTEKVLVNAICVN